MILMILNPQKYTWNKASGAQAREDSMPKAFFGFTTLGLSSLIGAGAGAYYGTGMALATNAASSVGIFSTVAMGALGVAGGLVAGAVNGLFVGGAIILTTMATVSLTRLAWNTGVKLICGAVNKCGGLLSNKTPPNSNNITPQIKRAPLSHLNKKQVTNVFSKTAPETANQNNKAAPPSKKKTASNKKSSLSK